MATKKTRPEASAPTPGGQAPSVRPVETAPARTPAPRVAKGKAPARATPAATSRSRGQSARIANADMGGSAVPSRAGARSNGTSGGRASKHAHPAKAASGKPEAVRASEVTDDDIRVRAYFLSLEHGPAGVSELECWIRAERELRGSSRGE